MSRQALGLAVVVTLCIPNAPWAEDFRENTIVLAQMSYTHSRATCANTADPNAVLADFYARYAFNTSTTAFTTGNSDYNYYTWLYSVEAMKQAQTSYFTTFDTNAYYAGLWHYWAAVYAQASFIYDQ
jgi:homogentisate 1,2-dioxygenase